MPVVPPLEMHLTLRPNAHTLPQMRLIMRVIRIIPDLKFFAAYMSVISWSYGGIAMEQVSNHGNF